MEGGVEPRKGGEEASRREGGALNGVFVIVNKAVGWGWDIRVRVRCGHHGFWG